MFIFFATFLVIETTSSVCPDSSLLKPCSCMTDEIHCRVSIDIDLVKIFETLGKQLLKKGKHFKKFVLAYVKNTELKENTFSDVTFDAIRIFSNENLRSIHKNTFTKTDLVTKQVRIEENLSLTSPDGSIFEALQKFVHAEKIHLYNNNITEIPSNAFSNNQDQLSYLALGGPSMSKIGDNAFSRSKNLSRLDIGYTSIDFISEKAFEFYEESNQSLVIYLVNNKYLDTSSFSENSPSNIKRKTFVYLDDSRFKYLDEKVFYPFFKSNPKNGISSSVDCSDCRNFWLKMKSSMLNAKSIPQCLNEKSLNDPANFIGCEVEIETNSCVINKKESSIHCGGIQKIDLKLIFKNYSKSLSDNEKHFKSLYLNNTSIEVLEENSFDEITFDSITIENCLNLKTIDKNAFTETLLVTKNLNLLSNPKLTSPDNSIFDIFSRFKALEILAIKDVNITEILSNAFRPLNGHQKNLFTISIQSCPIKKIGSGAFSPLKNLISLNFYEVGFESISENAFAFDEPSDTPFELIFDNYNDFNTTVFNEKSLVNIRRPTKLLLRMKPEI